MVDARAQAVAALRQARGALLRARAHLALGEPEAALRDLREVIQRGALAFEAHLLRLQVFEALEDPVRALDEYDHLLRETADLPIRGDLRRRRAEVGARLLAARR